jgi:outer membrane protein TolC
MPPSGVIGSDPATVLDLKRQLRSISLKEAIAIAVEQGNTGAAGGQGQDITTPAQTSGRSAQSDTIKAFALDPAIAAAEAERVLSRFDARWISSMSWNKQDQATLTLQQSFSNGDNAAFTSTLAKPLPTGGVAGITVSMNYLNLSNPPANTQFVALSTSYTPRVQFVFEQPLLQGFGVEANQLLANHPGSLLIQGFRATGAANEGILISRVRSEQARTQFDVQFNQLLVNVEAAYWNLYAEYYNLYAQQLGLQQAFEALAFMRPRVVVGVEQEQQQLPLLESQYHQFYQRVVEARGRVLEADRILRGLLGMKSDDGTIFTPSDEPVRAPFKFDFKSIYDEGLQNRPEVILARQELKVQQLNIQAQKYARMPDLRMFSSYDVNGLGGRLTGDASNALTSLANNQFNSWQVGLRLDMPLGFREGNALVRQAQLNLWRSYYTLSDAERKLFELLVQSKRQLDQAYATIEIQRRVKEANQRQVDIIVKRITAGAYQGSGPFLQFTTAQQNLANALSAEYRALADYNSALARIEFAKGTIQRYNNVSVAEGPLPSFVQKKAADHFREREAAIKLREHPAEDGLQGFQMMPLEQMPNPLDVLNGGMPATPAIPAVSPPNFGPMKQPGETPVAPGGQQPVSTIKPYDKWELAPGGSGSGASLPATLPSMKSIQSTAPTEAGTFVPNGSLTLPKRNVSSVGDTPPPPSGTPVNAQPK